MARSSTRKTPLTTDAVHRAVRHLLQLVVEWDTDGAAYADGDAALAQVVGVLEAHHAMRAALRQRALVAELVPNVMECFALEDQKRISRTETCERVGRWLRRAGFKLDRDAVDAVLKAPLKRLAARTRSRQEELVERLAVHLLGISQSDLEKQVAVISRGRETPGRIGNADLHERAARDRSPSPREMLRYAVYALRIEKEAADKVTALLPTLTDEAVDRRESAAFLASGAEAKRRRKTKNA